MTLEMYTDMDFIDVTVGALRDSDGNVVAADVIFNPQYERTVHLASGDVVYGTAIVKELSAENGGMLTQRIYASDTRGLAVSNFDWMVTVKAKGIKGYSSSALSYQKRVRFLRAAGRVDFDLLQQVSQPSVPDLVLPVVTSIAGLSGNVTAQQLTDAGLGGGPGGGYQIPAGGIPPTDFDEATQTLLAGAVALGPDGKLPRDLIPDGVGGTAAGGSGLGYTGLDLSAGASVSSQIYGATTLDPQTAQGTARVLLTLSSAVSQLKFVYHGWRISKTGDRVDVSNAAPMTLSAAVEIGGVIYPLTAGGQRTFTVPVGGQVITDALVVSLPAGAVIAARTYTSGASWQPTRYVGTPGSGGWAPGADLTAAGAAAVPNVTDQPYVITPNVVLGQPSGAFPLSVFSYGDSIDAGYGDAPFPFGVVGVNLAALGAGGGGWVGRAFAPSCGAILVGSSGDNANVFVTAGASAPRLTLARFARVASCGYGRNDLSNGRTAAQVMANLVSAWQLVSSKGLTVWQRTITPKNASSNGWMTTAGQSGPLANPARIAVNDWLRDGAPLVDGAPAAVGASGAARCAVYGAGQALVAGAGGPPHALAGVWESADPVETARGSGVWKAAANARALTANMTAGSATLNASNGAFTAADLGRQVSVPGAGAAGAVLLAGIVAVTSATVVTLATSATAAVTGVAASVADTYTNDGVHPAQIAAAAMAANCPVAAMLASAPPVRYVAPPLAAGSVTATMLSADLLALIAAGSSGGGTPPPAVPGFFSTSFDIASASGIPGFSVLAGGLPEDCFTSGGFAGSTGASGVGTRWRLATTSPTTKAQYVTMVVTAPPGGNAPDPTLVLRFTGDDATRTCYFARLLPKAAGGAQWQIYANVNGVATKLASAVVTAAITYPYEGRFEITETDDMKFKVNNVVVGTASDASHRATAVGKAGLALGWGVAGDEAQRVASYESGNL